MLWRRWRVNRLRLPDPLIELLKGGRWRHPGDDVVSSTVPFIQAPVDFLGVEAMRRESAFRNVQQVLGERRAAPGEPPVELPWLDVDRAVLVAVNRELGEDVGIALDYRTSNTDPRVLATYWPDGARHAEWREVAPTFTAFARLLGLR